MTTFRGQSVLRYGSHMFAFNVLALDPVTFFASQGTLCNGCPEFQAVQVFERIETPSVNDADMYRTYQDFRNTFFQHVVQVVDRMYRCTVFQQEMYISKCTRENTPVETTV